MPYREEEWEEFLSVIVKTGDLLEEGGLAPEETGTLVSLMPHLKAQNFVLVT